MSLLPPYYGCFTCKNMYFFAFFKLAKATAKRAKSARHARFSRSMSDARLLRSPYKCDKITPVMQAIPLVAFSLKCLKSMNVVAHPAFCSSSSYRSTCPFVTAWFIYYWFQAFIFWLVRQENRSVISAFYICCSVQMYQWKELLA